MPRFFTDGNVADQAYLFNRDTPERVGFRDYLEALWIQYEPFADSHFLVEARNQFHNRTWEMYLACTFFQQGISLQKHADHGPDIKFLLGGKTAWCEAIAVGRGTGDDAVPEMHVARNLSEIIAQNVPEEQMILRITSGIHTKHKKYLEYLEAGVIQDCEPYIIALNRYDTAFVDPGNCPLILKALFGFGYQAFDRDGHSFWTKRSTITRESGDAISTVIFENPDYAGISAIIYETDHIVSLQNEPMGGNFIIVHNPLAINPIPRNMLRVKAEYPLE